MAFYRKRFARILIPYFIVAIPAWGWRDLIFEDVYKRQVYYIVNGYRESIFYCRTFLDHPLQTIYFWGIVVLLFVIGCSLMYKFKTKFIDMI